MSKYVGNELPDDLYQRLSGRDLTHQAGKAILIATVDAEGYSHPAMLSYFEVIAKDRQNIRLATYKDSGTTHNMRRNGKLTISIIEERVAYYIKGRAEELQCGMNSSKHNSKLNMKIEQVLSDEADQALESGAHVTSGVRYHEPDPVTAQLHAREILKELLE